jgi:hypothetical protein
MQNLVSFESEQTPAHQHQMLKKLDYFAQGNPGKLMILAPPRSGKSILASILFPVRYLTRNPGKHLLSVTYSKHLAERFAQDIDRLLDGVSGGKHTAMGVGDSVESTPIDCLVLDDPLKTQEEANDEKYCRKVADWYRSLTSQCLTEHSAVIVVMTRWSQHDLAGTLLREQPQDWDVLKIPAINEDGQSYWPEQYPLERLNKIRGSITPSQWAALYQQEPV